MDNFPVWLEILIGVLAIIGTLSTIIVPALMWKLKDKFALRTELGTIRSNFRGIAQRLNRKLDEKTEELDKDFREGFTRLEYTLSKAIKDSHESVCKDINGLGEKWTATLRIAELAMTRADDAQDALNVLREQVKSIDTYGTKAMREVSENINQLRLELQKHRRET